VLRKEQSKDRSESFRGTRRQLQRFAQQKIRAGLPDKVLVVRPARRLHRSGADDYGSGDHYKRLCSPAHSASFVLDGKVVEPRHLILAVNITELVKLSSRRCRHRYSGKDDQEDKAAFKAIHLFNPICNEDVGISAGGGVPVRSKYEFFAVRRKHGEPVKGFVCCDAFQAGTVYMNFV